MLARGRQCRHGPTVETILQSDHPPGVPPLHNLLIAPRDLDCRLVGFRAGIAEKGLARMAGGKQLFREVQLFFLIKKIAHMDELPGLTRDDLRNFLIAVSKPRHRNARQQIHIFPAVRVPQTRTLRPDHRQGVTAVGAAQKLLFPFPESFQRLAHANAPWSVLRLNIFLPPNPMFRRAGFMSEAGA